MPRQDLHKKAYDEGTKEKLELYRDYLREWLPVFINSKYVDTLQIFDFFAGPGIDIDGNPGSPVITCDEIRKALSQHVKKQPIIKVYFNEYDAIKFKKLSKCLDEQKQSLQQVTFDKSQNDFHDAFDQWESLMKGKVANLLFLDQSGLDQINNKIFQNIVKLPKTDVIFFISSALVHRFKKKPEIIKHVPVTTEDFALMNNTNVHRILANAYQRWIPNNKQYFLGSFSIKKGANVYGLVFGSGHPLGIDKFLQVAWKHDKISGNANFDIDGDGIDPLQPSLFKEDDIPNKIKVFEKELEKAILDRSLTTNKDIFIFALQNGMLASHARDALDLLIKKEKLPKQKFNVSYNAWKLDAQCVQHFTGENK
jgi:three-Cys-motif partner protein